MIEKILQIILAILSVIASFLIIRFISHELNIKFNQIILALMYGILFGGIYYLGIILIKKFFGRF